MRKCKQSRHPGITTIKIHKGNNKIKAKFNYLCRSNAKYMIKLIKTLKVNYKNAKLSKKIK